MPLTLIKYADFRKYLHGELWKNWSEGITYIKKSIYEAVMSCKTVFIDYIQKMGIDFTHKNLKSELL